MRTTRHCYYRQICAPSSLSRQKVHPITSIGLTPFWTMEQNKLAGFQCFVSEEELIYGASVQIEEFLMSVKKTIHNPLHLIQRHPHKWIEAIFWFWQIIFPKIHATIHLDIGFKKIQYYYYYVEYQSCCPYNLSGMLNLLRNLKIFYQMHLNNMNKLISYYVAKILMPLAYNLIHCSCIIPFHPYFLTRSNYLL